MSTSQPITISRLHCDGGADYTWAPPNAIKPYLDSVDLIPTSENNLLGTAILALKKNNKNIKRININNDSI